MLKIWRKKSFLNINITNLCLNGLKWTAFYHHHFQSLSTVPRACTWVFDVIFASPCTISMFRRAAIVLYFVDLHTETVRMVPHMFQCFAQLTVPYLPFLQDWHHSSGLSKVAQIQVHAHEKKLLSLIKIEDRKKPTAYIVVNITNLD